MEDWLKSNGYWLLPLLLLWGWWQRRTGSASERGGGEKPPSVAWPILGSVLGLAVVWAFSSGKIVVNPDEVLREDPSFRALMVEREGMLRALEGKDPVLAIIYFDKIIRRDPTSAPAYANRGVAYALKGMSDRAIADCTQAIELDPRNAAAYFGRGCAYRLKQDHDRAISDLTEAIRLDPTNAYAYYTRGLSYTARGDEAHAAADREEAIRLDPALGPK